MQDQAVCREEAGAKTKQLSPVCQSGLPRQLQSLLLCSLLIPAADDTGTLQNK